MARKGSRLAADLPVPSFSVSERRADAAVHLIGLSFGVAGAIALLIRAVPQAGPAASIGLVAYSTGLLSMLASSAVYNLTRGSAWSESLRRLDHAAIFPMIAGTATPFILLRPDNANGLMLLALIWTLAIAGAIAKIGWPRRLERASIVGYLALGWTTPMAIDFVNDALSNGVIVLLVAGGLTYSVGVIFHLARRLPYHNVIWHGMVLAAAACHYAAVLQTVGGETAG